MGDPASSSTNSYQCGGVHPRRKSLLHRITDSLSSFFPSSFFESNREVTSSATPQKRTRLDLPEQQEQASQSNPPRSEEDEELPPASYFYSKSTISTDFRNSSAPKNNVDLDAKDDSSDNSVDSKDSVSTSGVSSLLPHYSRHQPQCSTSNRSRTQDRAAQYKCPSVISRDVSTCSKEVSMTKLWIDSDQQKRPAAYADQPSSKRMRTESTQTCPTTYPSSPFYGGRTSYGGLKQHRCRGIFEHVAPLKFIVETAEKSPIPISQGASSAMLSATARRILENLERHSSPITSNDKIPLPTPRPLPPPVLPLRARTTRYPSYMAAYHRFKASQRQQTHLISGASNDSTSQKTLFRYVESEDRSSGSGKATTDKDHILYSQDATRRPQVSHQPTPTPLSLPKVAASPSIRNEPKYVRAVVSSATSSPAVTVSRQLNSDGLRRISSSPAFKFSSPISLKIQPSSRPSMISPDLHYTFSHPKSSLKVPAVSSSSFLPVLFSTDRLTTSNVSTKPACTAIGLSLWRCESCLTENSGSTCASCHLPKPASKGSGSSNSTEPKSFESCSGNSKESNVPATRKKSGDWTCDTCLVNNAGTSTKCVCCEAAKPTPSNGSITHDGGLHFKTGSTPQTTKPSWNCPTCLVSNKGDSDACVCCQTKRSVPSSTKTMAPSLNFGKPLSLTSGDATLEKSTNDPNLFKNSVWECPTCMVSNKDSLNECPCCQTKRPGVSSGEKSSAPAVPSFRFGGFSSSQSEKPLMSSAPGSSNVNGYFGSSVASTWNCPSCLVTNKSTVDQCPCCETRRPHSDEVSSAALNTPSVKFSFGSPTASTDRLASSSPPVIISHIKATPFKFGAPAVPQTTASAVPNFSFGAHSASTASSVTSQSPAFSFSASPITSTPVLNKHITESKSGNPVVSTSANFTLGFKSANFSVVKPSTSLAYGLSPKPVDSAVNTSAGSASNGTQPALPASNSLFGQIRFGSSSSAPSSNLNGIPSTSNSANSVAPTFVFGATTMKENVTPPIGLNSQTGTLFAKPPSAASTPATNQPTAPFKFGDANQPAALFKFGDTNQPAPFKFGDANQPAPFLFSASSNGSTGGPAFYNPPSNGLQPTTRPIRRAVRRFHRN